MPEFSPRRRAETGRAKKPPEAKKTDPNADPKANAALLQLQKTFGNKQMIEMLSRAKFETDRQQKDAVGPEMLEKFQPPPDNLVLMVGTQIFTEQLTAYQQYISAYSDYVEQIRKHSAYGLFWKYQESFQHFAQDIIQDVLMRGLRDMMTLVSSELPDDSASRDMLKVLQETESELKKRESGEDVKKVNQRISIQTDISKMKEGAQLEKTISDSIDMSTPPEDYIKMFLKNNGIMLETLEKSVKEEAEALKPPATDMPVEDTAPAATTAADTRPDTPVIAVGNSGNKP